MCCCGCALALAVAEAEFAERDRRSDQARPVGALVDHTGKMEVQPDAASSVLSHSNMISVAASNAAPRATTRSASGEAAHGIAGKWLRRAIAALARSPVEPANGAPNTHTRHWSPVT